MMPKYAQFADDYYININLNTEIELPSERETLLHFFEQVKKNYPTMRNFYSRERGECVLEEDKDPGHYRWTSVETKRISSGYVNPPSLDAAMEQHLFIFDLIGYSLSVSPLDCESLNVMFGFDFNYRGNHHELMASALGVVPALESLFAIEGARSITHETAITMALQEDCRTQFRLQIEPRTSAFHIRTGEYVEEPLSVYLTVRRYGSLETGESFVSKVRALQEVAVELLEGHVIPQVLLPLQRAISLK